jgi:membrane-bound serine protease (ClpP class)
MQHFWFLVLLAFSLMTAPLVASDIDRSQDSPSATVAVDATDDADVADGSTHIDGAVAVIRLEGVVEPHLQRYLDRALAAAQEQGVKTLITEIHSPGGRVDSTIEMLDALLAVEDMRLIAVVDTSAYSAAALLAYAHHEIYISERASIGNIGVIFQSAEGIEHAPEKVQTVIRDWQTKLSQVRGWPKPLLLKMTAKDWILYEARFPDGRREIVIDEDKGVFLADHPEIDPEDRFQWVQMKGEDTLLTLTGRSAVEQHMATALEPSYEAVLNRLGIEPQEIIDLRPTETEEFARMLASYAPLLAGLALLFLLFELKTAGVGWFAILAACFGGLFVLTQYSLELMTHFEVVLIVLGILLIVAEVFTAVGGGLIAIVGGGFIFLGLFMGFLPPGAFDDVETRGFSPILWQALFNTILAGGIACIGVIGFILAAPKLPVVQRLAAAEAIAGTSASQAEIDQALVGQHGVVVAECRPSGSVSIAGRAPQSALAEHGHFLVTGTPVRVVAMRYGELVVGALPPQPASEATDAS